MNLAQEREEKYFYMLELSSNNFFWINLKKNYIYKFFLKTFFNVKKLAQGAIAKAWFFKLLMVAHLMKVEGIGRSSTGNRCKMKYSFGKD